MVEFIVIEHLEDGHPKGLGLHQFRAVPRVGEHIAMNDDQGIGQVYKVVAIIHPLDPGDNAGDIIVRYISTITEFHKSF